MNQNLTSIINDLKNATKKAESRISSRENMNTYEFDHDNKIKNFKSSIENQTLDSNCSNQNKTEMSEFTSNSQGVKMHKRYESHQNINSLLKKNNEYYTNPNRSNVRKSFNFLKLNLIIFSMLTINQ